MKVRGAILAAAVLVVGSATARQALAETVYSQPTSMDQSYFSDVNSSWTAYDNFTLVSDATITSVAWAGAASDLTAAPSFTISFYSSNGDLPGTLLSSTAVGNGSPVQIPGAPSDGFDTYSASINPFSASAGTEYWISIFDNETNPGIDWAWFAGTGGDSGEVSISSLGYVSPDSNDLAFSLNTAAPTAATPEPSALVLLGTSLLGAAGIARRRIFNA